MHIGTHQLILRAADGDTVLSLSVIVHIVAEGSYSRLYCDDGSRHLACHNLGAFDANLVRSDGGIFFRCHNSHIVNLLKIVKLIRKDGFTAVMTSGLHVPISRRKAKGFIAALKAA